jgi:Cu(I)/Ag(I) efflux system membrane fusion protein
MTKSLVSVVVVVALAAGAYAGYRLAHHRLMSASATPAPAQEGKPVLYWYDPMYPQQKFDQPGKSPFMDMQLVPKYADEAGAQAGTVSISPQIAQNLGIRVAPAQSGSLQSRFETVGSVAYNERGVVQLQARAAGFVELLHARAPLDPVKKGAPLVAILYPEWAGAQEEYLLLRRHDAPGMKELAASARRRLSLLGMSEAEIRAVDREGETRARVTLRSPIDGVIAELGVREGMTVAPGAALFRIVDLSTVWVNAEVPEAQGARVRPGARVRARVTAYPGEVFEGRVGAILPEVNAATRTLRARVELANPGARLKPGMYATLEFAGERSKDAVLVPSEAVIRTGTRDAVIVAQGEGRFRVVEIEVGAEAGGQSEIRSGLRAGDNVVLSGQFLIDSEASLTATVSRLASSEQKHLGRGVVTAVDAATGHVELEHEPMPSLQWPAMTMGFVVPDKSQLGALKPGDRVAFELKAKPDADGNYIIESISR